MFHHTEALSISCLHQSLTSQKKNLILTKIWIWS